MLALLAAAAALAVIAWLLPTSATLIHSRELPQATPAEFVLGSLRIVANGEFGDPRQSYPAPARATMPAGHSWWFGALAPLALFLLGGALAWRRFEPLRARALLGRRRYDPRGARPRDWGRPRDLGALRVRRRTVDRFSLGWLDRRLLASDDEAHAVVVAPTRSGKTTTCVIPWLLEHPGPAVVTSTKRDVFDATSEWRSRCGRVEVWDPGARDSVAWTPLDGCASWAFALRQGLWLADAVDAGDHHAARYWNAEAAKLLAPLLHAAALDSRSIGQVIEWLDTQEFEEPATILGARGDSSAQRQLAAVAGLDPRNRGTTYMSAGSLLAAYRHPDVLASARAGFDVRAFLDGAPNTLYICAPAHRQRMLAPLVVAILSSVLEAAADRERTAGPLAPTLRILLDEAANIAPLRELPLHLSQAAAHGVRIASVWQSLAQIRDRYADAADTILANSTAKLFLGPVTDEATRSYLERLLGGQTAPRDDRRPAPPKVTAQALQQLGGDRALLVSGSSPPATVRLRRFWATRDLRSRAPTQRRGTR